MAQESPAPREVKHEQRGHGHHASYHKPRVVEAPERPARERVQPETPPSELESAHTPMELAAAEILNPAYVSPVEIIVEPTDEDYKTVPSEIELVEEIPSAEYTQAEEAENILAVESEEVSVEAPVAVEVADVPVSIKVEATTEAEHKPGDPAEVHGEKVYIEQKFVGPEGTVVYEVTRNDASKTLVYGNGLVFLDPVKEKVLEAMRLKELFDSGSGFIKATHTFSHLGDRWTDPQDATINRGINPVAPFEEQEAARMHNRTVYLLGVTVVFVNALLVARNAPHSQPLFGITAIELTTPIVNEAPSSFIPPLSAALQANEPASHPASSHWFSKILR